MGKDRIFSIYPFLNAMTADTVRSSPGDMKVYPFYNTDSVLLK
jgi:hypothetical protein